MQIKTENLLPKILPGTVHEQYVRCGKSNCKCSRGELHGAYYYHFVRVGVRLTKRYLKSDEVEAFRSACRNRQLLEQQHRLETDKVWKKLRLMRTQLQQITGEFTR